MKKYELLNQLLNEKAEAMKTIEELCAEWNITLSDKEAQVINNIIINKGKVVAVETIKEVVKEVVVDNTDNDRIQELEEKLTFKELLLSEFKDNMDEKIKTINEQKNKIEDLEIELESKDSFIEGMKLSYEQQIAELKATIRKLNTKTMFLEADDEIFEEEEEEIVAGNEGGDAVEPQFINIPDKYKDHPEIIETIKDFTDKWNNAQENRLIGLTREQVQANYVIAANETLETIIAELKEADKYNISFTKLLNNKNKTVVAVVGRITLNGQEYPFKYGATHKLPCIYGCYDKALIEEAKEALFNAIHMIKDETTEKHVFDVVYEMNKGIVVWQTNDGVFKGYARAKSQRNGKRNSYAFVWDGTSAVPTACWCDHMYVRQSNGQHMTTDDFEPMNRRWGAGIASLGQEIMAFCKTIDKRTQVTKEITKEQPKDIISVTNEEVYKITKEVPQTTKEVVNVTKEVEDLDI